MLLKPTHLAIHQPLMVSGLLLAISWVGESKAGEVHMPQPGSLEDTTVQSTDTDSSAAAVTPANDTDNAREAAVELRREGLQIADNRYRYTISTSLWTTHFNPQPEHNNTQRFLGIERHGDNFVTEPLQAHFAVLESADPLLGVSHFHNSYHQSTLFVYAGLSKVFGEHRAVTARVKVSAGFLHGYRNQFQYKVPLNNLGTSPAAIPSVTLHYGRFNTEMILFGTSGMMINLGYSF